VTKTRSIPCWTTGVFSFTVTGLVLIYEFVTSSVSFVRWLTLHSGTFNSVELLNWLLNSLTTESLNWINSPELNWTELNWSELNSTVLRMLNARTLLRMTTESESYVTTDGQSASLSWNKSPIWGLRPDFYYCQTVAGLLMWGSLTRRRVCRLQLLLDLASAVSVESEYRRSRDHMLLTQIWDHPFRRLLRLAGLQWRYSTPPPYRLVAELSRLSLAQAA
jgi:hypothetical protein